MKYLLPILLFLTNTISAQEVEMADAMRSNGKIYVVVAGVLVILIGLFIFLTRIEKKLKKLEAELKD